jgi:hypothetical protein
VMIPLDGFGQFQRERSRFGGRDGHGLPSPESPSLR